MPAPSIDALPTAPSRSNVANFNTDAEAWVAALSTFRDQAQAFIDYINSQTVVIGDQINGTPIGQTNPAAGKFTTLEASSLGASGLFGLGATSAVPEIPDVDAIYTPTGIWRFTNTTVNDSSLPPELQGNFGLIKVFHSASNTLAQEAGRNNGDGGLFRRVYSGGAWQAWDKVYSQQNILGTVTESGGVPTGALIERGSNANGEYVRFSDGTLFCWHEFTADVAISTALMGGFRSPDMDWTFPATFTAAPVASALPVSFASFGVSSRTYGSATAAVFNLTAVTSQSSETRRIRCSAIGRWY